MRLPQLEGRPMVTDGGLETDMIFNHGVDLPLFAAFPLVETADGRALLEGYYDGYAATTRDIVLGGVVGPRGDGYRPGRAVDPDEAAAYHRPQIEAFARAGADMVTAYTLTDIGEGVGIARAAQAVGLPVAISFTVETDGRLPTGATLAQAVTEVDGAAPPDYFLVNCAHPTHIEPGLDEPGAWRDRIIGIRANASTKSHAELDDATELDAGDPPSLAQAHHRLHPLLPRLSIIGGCCGTDTRHVASLWSDRS